MRALAACAVWCLAASPAFGDSKVGNGGDAVVCSADDGTIKSVRVLDFYEGEFFRGLVPALGPASLAPIDKAVSAFQRMERFDPERAGRFITAAKAFFDNAVVKDGELTDIPDSLHRAYERGCEVKQLAIQDEPQVPEDKLYVVDEFLWKKMGTDDQAGLIIHEVIYTEAIARGQPDSRMTRYLAALVASDKLESYTQEQYVNALQRAGFDAQHGFDRQAAWRLALLPDKPRTFADAESACAMLGPDYRLPDIRELLDLQTRIARTRLSGYLFQSPEGEVSPLVWSSSRANRVPTCPDLPVKALRFPEDVGAPKIEILCGTAVEPRTLCLAQDDVMPTDTQGNTAQQDTKQDDPTQQDDPSQGLPDLGHR